MPKVALMADVYKKAKGTVVWLGKALEEEFSENIVAGANSEAFPINNMVTGQHAQP